MNEEYTTVVDLLADSIIDAVALDIENRSHYVELHRFDNDMPTNDEQRKIFINALVNAVKNRMNDACVYVTEDDELFIDEL